MCRNESIANAMEWALTSALNLGPSGLCTTQTLSLGFVEQHRSRRWRWLGGNVCFLNCFSIGAQLKGVLSPDLPFRSIGDFQGMGSFHLYCHGRGTPEFHLRAVEFARGWLCGIG